MSLTVTKGHGTRNDFVLVDGRDGAPVDADLVRALCDRRAGVGGDGVLRLVPVTAVPEAGDQPGATWFMDYRNADGSISEMCGNGVRVTAHFARRLGLWDPADGDLALGTRDGVKRVRAEVGPDGAPWYAVDMGRWTLPGGPAAVAAGGDVHVTARGWDVARAGLSVSTGNPHVVVALPGERVLADADLAVAPALEPAPPAGANVELVVVLGTSDGVGRLRMRVHERGVGETQSCGTGACAAAMAVRSWAGEGAPDVWFVDVPGGTLRVTALPGGRVELAGPAVLVGDVTLDVEALAR